MDPAAVTEQIIQTRIRKGIRWADVAAGTRRKQGMGDRGFAGQGMVGQRRT
jgi:hypothetical protein